MISKIIRSGFKVYFELNSEKSIKLKLIIKITSETIKPKFSYNG